MPRAIQPQNLTLSTPNSIWPSERYSLHPEYTKVTNVLALARFPTLGHDAEGKTKHVPGLVRQDDSVVPPVRPVPSPFLSVSRYTGKGLGEDHSQSGCTEDCLAFLLDLLFQLHRVLLLFLCPL